MKAEKALQRHSAHIEGDIPTSVVETKEWDPTGISREVLGHNISHVVAIRMIIQALGSASRAGPAERPKELQPDRTTKQTGMAKTQTLTCETLGYMHGILQTG